MTLACRGLGHHGAAASQTCVCREEPVRRTPMADNSSPDVHPPLLDGPASADLDGGRTGTSGGISAAGSAHGERPSPTGPSRRGPGRQTGDEDGGPGDAPARARPGRRRCPGRLSPCRRGAYLTTPTKATLSSEPTQGGARGKGPSHPQGPGGRARGGPPPRPRLPSTPAPSSTAQGTRRCWLIESGSATPNSDTCHARPRRRTQMLPHLPSWTNMNYATAIGSDVGDGSGADGRRLRG